MIEISPKIKSSVKISQIFANPEGSKLIKQINDQYYYWDKVKYQKAPTSITPQELWSAVKLNRIMNYNYLRFGKYMFAFFLTDYMQKTLHYLDLNVGGYLGSQDFIHDEEKERYLTSSIMEEAIASSQMEGAVSTRKRAKDMLRKEIKPRTKSDQMIVNNYQTIKHIVENKQNELTPEKLLEIHQLITHKTLDEKTDEGCFRTSDDVYVVNQLESEIVHSPPLKSEIPDLIDQLCSFFNTDDENLFLHPIVKGIILHFMIGYIHPFIDGNGRTARALFYWYLLRKGYWLTEYLSISKIIIDTKSQYEKAFLYTENDMNDMGYFITYNLQVMQKAYNALKAYIELKRKENKQVTDFVRIPTVNERQAQLLKLFIDKPNRILTVKEVETRYTVSNYTARADLLGLVSLGFVEIIQVNKVKQNFVRSADFDKLLKESLKALNTNKPLD